MKKNEIVSIRLIESAYKQKFRYLFSCAYLITGNERKAESILMKVILSNPVPDEKDFEDIFEKTKELSLKETNLEDSALFSFMGDMSGVRLPLSEWILTLEEKKARTLVLRYALELSIKEIASITGDKPEKVKAVLERGKARAYNQAKGQKSALSLLKTASGEVALTACFPPDFSAILRSVERIMEDKSLSQQRSFSVKPVISWLVTSILMLLITLIIWMSVVLIDYFREPVKVKNPLFPNYTVSPENTEG